MIPEVATVREIDWENRSARSEKGSPRGEEGCRRKSNGEWNRWCCKPRKETENRLGTANGGDREIEMERRNGREAESGESSGTSSCRSRGGWLLS